jgi:hypothetical protein
MKIGSILVGAMLILPLFIFSCAGTGDGPDVQRDKLILEYLFDGNANDTGGNGNDGTVNGATLVSDRFGRSNHAYRFVSEESDEIVCADAPELNPTDALTVTLWMRPTVFDVNGRMISKRSGDGGWEIDIYYDQIRFFRQASVLNFYSTDTLTVDEWIFVGMTFEDLEQHMYVNGEEIGSTSQVMYGVSNLDLVIGRTAGSTSNYFSGDIDDVRLYNAILSSDDIETLYHAGDWDMP